jgi:hypothetical protein
MQNLNAALEERYKELARRKKQKHSLNTAILALTETLRFKISFGVMPLFFSFLSILVKEIKNC